MLIKEYKDKYGIRFFVGSEYCEGLTANFDKAVEQEAYGFVTAPKHDLQVRKHNEIETWMVEALKETNKKWNEVWL